MLLYDSYPNTVIEDYFSSDVSKHKLIDFNTYSDRPVSKKLKKKV